MIPSRTNYGFLGTSDKRWFKLYANYVLTKELSAAQKMSINCPSLEIWLDNSSNYIIFEIQSVEIMGVSGFPYTDHYPSISPAVNQTGLLGTTDKQWYELYAAHVYANNVELTSDERLKENIRPLFTPGEALSKISQLRGVKYDAKPGTKLYDEKDPESNSDIIGVIAQELKEHFPNLVNQGEDGYYTVEYNGLIPILLEAVKELNNKHTEKDIAISNMQSQMENLLEKITLLETSIQELIER